MEQFLQELWSNRILMAALIGWAVAQLLKLVIYAILFKEWKPQRLIGSGGMPSSHASTVCAMTVSALLHYGVSTPVFAVCVVLTAVVLHDARGVRLETGKQAKMITAITNFLEKSYNQDVFPEVELKELVGHTPFQVVIGSVLGVVIGLLVG